MRCACALICWTALASCAPAPVDLASRLGCTTVEGAEHLLENPNGAVILVDGDGAAAPASEALGCLAAARGERVVLGAVEESAAILTRPVSLWEERGGAVDIFQFETAAPPAQRGGAIEELDRRIGDARNEAFARSVAVAQTLAPDRLILVVAPPDGARAPVGLSGHTWRPLGARLPPANTLSLRAEMSPRPGIRVRMMPFEDVPARGAALRYDGIVEVGPPVQQASAPQAPS